MNELDFRLWLQKKNINNKVISDIISRLKKIERETNFVDLDEHYKNDHCRFLLSLFKNKGENDNLKLFPNANFPVGKYHMNTYRYALNYYIKFLDDSANNTDSKNSKSSGC